MAGELVACYASYATMVEVGQEEMEKTITEDEAMALALEAQQMTRGALRRMRA